MASSRHSGPRRGSPGPIASLVVASTVLGRKWHPVIVHRLLQDDPLGFAALESDVSGLSGKVLSESLSDLEESGLVERTVVDAKPVRVEYSLTAHGRALEPAISELHGWGVEYLTSEVASSESTR